MCPEECSCSARSTKVPSSAVSEQEQPASYRARYPDRQTHVWTVQSFRCYWELEMSRATAPAKARKRDLNRVYVHQRSCRTWSGYGTRALSGLRPSSNVSTL